MATGWERLAVFEGGTVAGLARAQAADGAWHVFAATPVGVFRSRDRGLSWTPLGAGSRVAGAAVIAASPRYAEDGLVYVGARSGLYQWQGDGPSWQQILTDCVVQTIALDAGKPDIRPDGSGLTVLVGTQDDGVLKSLDGGRTWNGANAGLLDLDVESIALSPSFQDDGIAFAATADGLYRTRNGGEAWRQLDVDGNDDFFDAVAVSPGFAEDRRVIVSSVESGLLRSDDGGRSWTDINVDEDIPDDEDSVQSEMGDVSQVALWSTERAVVCSEQGVALSTDGGDTWRLRHRNQWADAVRYASSAVCLDATDSAPEVLLVGTARDGIVRSEDGGASWQPSSAGLMASLISNLLLSPAFADDQTVYSVSLGGDLQRSADGGRTWSAVDTTIELDDDDEAAWEYDDDPDRTIHVQAVIPSPPGGHTLVGASSHGVRLLHDGAEDWQPAWEGVPFAAETPPIMQAVHAIATATTADGVHLLADVRATTTAWALLGSRDGGATWMELPAPDSDAFVKELAITPDSGLDGAHYVATHASFSGDLTLWRSEPGSQRWQSWYADPEAQRSMATPVIALPANPFGDSVVLAYSSRVLRPRPNAWEVTGGARRPVWDAVEPGGEGRAVSIAGLAVSPGYAQDRTLFAATSTGVYVSRDGGASFTAWSSGPDEREPAAVVAVAVSPAYTDDRLVYALGLGGTIWRRADR